MGEVLHDLHRCPLKALAHWQENAGRNHAVQQRMKPLVGQSKRVNEARVVFSKKARDQN